MDADGLDQYVFDLPVHLLVLGNDTGVRRSLVIDATGARATATGCSLLDLNASQLEDCPTERLYHLLII